MLPIVPLPSDVYEPVFSIVGGTANAVVTFGSAYLIGGGVKWYPIVPSVTLDALGNGSVTGTASIFAPGGAATPSVAYSWSTPVPTGLPATATCTSSPLSTFGEYARQLTSLIGPSTQAADGTRIAEDYRALASALTGRSATLDTLVADMFPDTATDLIGAWEAFLGLVSNPNLSLTTRQQNALAKWRAAFGGQPKVIQAALQAIDSAAQVLEWTQAQIATANAGNTAYLADVQRRVFMFSVTLQASTLANANAMVLITALLAQMQPAYAATSDANPKLGATVSGIGTKGPFKFDDAASLFDQTLLST